MEKEEIEALRDNKVINLMKELETQFHESAEDTVKFVQGNNSAGTRIRKIMQTIKNLAQEIRVEVQNQKNSVTV